MSYLKELTSLIGIGVLLFCVSCKEEKINMLPQSPVLVSPAYNASQLEKSTLFVWQSVSDPDGDEVLYDVYFGTDSINLPVVASNLVNTTYEPSLESHSKYFWKIVSKDGNDGFAESSIWSFTTSNSVPDTVEVDFLFSPLTAVDTLLELSWKQTNDLDDDEITYDLYLDTTANFTQKHLSTTELSVNLNLMPNTYYYWKVIANDGFGGTASSVTNQFLTKMGAPSPFSLLYPVNNESVNASHFTLVWNPSVANDPNKSTIVYDIYVDTISEPMKKVASDVRNTTFLKADLKGDLDYYWKVVAKDNQGNQVSSSIAKFHYVKQVLLSYMTDSTVQDLRDNQLYHHEKMGSLRWMTENLRYDVGHKEVNYTDYNIAEKGRLYKYADLPNVCPDGWHVPSKEDWGELISYVSAQGFAGAEGKALKSKTDWLVVTTSTPNGTNNFKFNGYPVGIGKYRGEVQILMKGRRVEYWSSTEFLNNDVREAYYYYLTSNSHNLDEGSTAIEKAYYRHVRCVISGN